MTKCPKGKKQLCVNLSEELFLDFHDAVAMVNMGKKMPERITKTDLVTRFIESWIQAQIAASEESVTVTPVAPTPVVGAATHIPSSTESAIATPIVPSSVAPSQKAVGNTEAIKNLITQAGPSKVWEPLELRDELIRLREQGLLKSKAHDLCIASHGVLKDLVKNGFLTTLSKGKYVLTEAFEVEAEVEKDGGGKITKPPHGMTTEKIEEVLDPLARTYRNE